MTQGLYVISEVIDWNEHSVEIKNDDDLFTKETSDRVRGILWKKGEIKLIDLRTEVIGKKQEEAKEIFHFLESFDPIDADSLICNLYDAVMESKIDPDGDRAKFLLKVLFDKYMGYGMADE